MCAARLAAWSARIFPRCLSECAAPKGFVANTVRRSLIILFVILLKFYIVLASRQQLSMNEATAKIYLSPVQPITNPLLTRQRAWISPSPMDTGGSLVYDAKWIQRMLRWTPSGRQITGCPRHNMALKISAFVYDFFLITE